VLHKFVLHVEYWRRSWIFDKLINEEIVVDRMVVNRFGIGDYIFVCLGQFWVHSTANFDVHSVVPS